VGAHAGSWGLARPAGAARLPRSGPPPRREGAPLAPSEDTSSPPSI
jgi:hypothetical protein